MPQANHLQQLPHQNGSPYTDQADQLTRQFLSWQAAHAQGQKMALKGMQQVRQGRTDDSASQKSKSSQLRST